MSSLDVTMRVLHILGAITAAGGTIFALVAVIPALKPLPDDIRAEVHERVRKRFAMLLGISIALLLGSGFYNYVKVKMGEHQGQSLYNGLMGLKILLALVVFFIGSALTGRAKAFEKLRQNRPKWMLINILLIVVILAIAAVLGKLPVVHA